MPEKTTPKHRLDPRAPFVLDMRTLGREPGAMRTVQRRVPAPAGLRLDLIGVPEGAPLDLDLRLESASEGVLVTGAATTTIAGERSEEHTSELQSRPHLVCRLLLETKK